MIGPVFTVFMFCPTTSFENKTGSWNDSDNQVFERAVEECRKYDHRQPCVSSFKKIKKNEYDVSCGPEKTDEDK